MSSEEILTGRIDDEAPTGVPCSMMGVVVKVGMRKKIECFNVVSNELCVISINGFGGFNYTLENGECHGLRELVRMEVASASETVEYWLRRGAV